MSRSANTLSALNSAPGAFGSAKTSEVLSARAERLRIARDQQEPRDVVAVVLDAALQHAEAENLRGARRGDGGGVGQLLIANQPRAAGGVVGGDDLDVGQPAQELLALRQRLRMRADAADLRQLGAGQRDQVVDDLELGLGDDRQIVLEQQVVVAMDAAARSSSRSAAGHARSAPPPPTAKTSSNCSHGTVSTPGHARCAAISL